MKVVPETVSPDPWLPALDVSTTERCVLQVARLEARKAPELLVDAGARLIADYPDLEIVFVGRSYGTRDGRPYAEWLRRRAVDSGSPCIFIAELGRHELLSWYEKARVVVQSSWFDSWGFSGLEALAAGRPLVCTERVGYADLIDEAGAGAVVPVGDNLALVETLRRYLDDRDAAAEAGRAARTLVTHGKLSETAVLGKTLAVYEEAIAKARGR